MCSALALWTAVFAVAVCALPARAQRLDTMVTNALREQGASVVRSGRPTRRDCGPLGESSSGGAWRVVVDRTSRADAAGARVSHAACVSHRDAARSVRASSRSAGKHRYGRSHRLPCRSAIVARATTCLRAPGALSTARVHASRGQSVLEQRTGDRCCDRGTRDGAQLRARYTGRSERGDRRRSRRSGGPYRQGSASFARGRKAVTPSS